MSLPTRILRALILALVLPALLVPSGWSAHWCWCEGLAGAGANECCAPVDSGSAALEDAVSCCTGETVSSRQDEHGNAKPHACGQSDCENCCKTVDAGDYELVYAPDAVVKAPPPAPTPIVASALPEFAPRAVYRVARSLAPPCASRLIPLRI